MDPSNFDTLSSTSMIYQSYISQLEEICLRLSSLEEPFWQHAWNFNVAENFSSRFHEVPWSPGSSGVSEALDCSISGSSESVTNESDDSSDRQLVVYEGRGDDEDEDEHSEAQVLSATCVVFTNYEGDVASVVDQHFSRSFSTQTKASFGSEKDSRPMSSRNFPPSFWNQGAISVSHGHGDLYSHGESMYHGATAHTPADPWHTHYQQYTAAAHHHRGLHEYHHHHQHMAGYGGLLLPPSPRIAPHAQYPKTVDWNHRLHHEQTAHHLDAASSYASYSNMAGLDTPVQESSKDLYWFG